MPKAANARARAISWMFAALNTVEPPLVECSFAFLFEQNQPWYDERRPMIQGRAQKTLQQLPNHLGDDEWLDDGLFSAGDLMMAAVLFRAIGSGLLDPFPNLCAYVARGQARPALKRAFEAQLAVFTALTSGAKEPE